VVLSILIIGVKLLFVVILNNFSGVDFDIKAGERICQMAIVKQISMDIVEVDKLNSTERGSGGFGSTGK
jgi:dUTP pyrophosphatase